MAPGSLWLLDGVPVVLEPGVVEVVAESAVEADVFSERAFDCTGGVGVETVVAADGVVVVTAFELAAVSGAAECTDFEPTVVGTSAVAEAAVLVCPVSEPVVLVLAPA